MAQKRIEQLLLNITFRFKLRNFYDGSEALRLRLQSSNQPTFLRFATLVRPIVRLWWLRGNHFGALSKPAAEKVSPQTEIASLEIVLCETL